MPRQRAQLTWEGLGGSVETVGPGAWHARVSNPRAWERAASRSLVLRPGRARGRRAPAWKHTLRLAVGSSLTCLGVIAQARKVTAKAARGFTHSQMRRFASGGRRKRLPLPSARTDGVMR